MLYRLFNLRCRINIFELSPNPCSLSICRCSPFALDCFVSGPAFTRAVKGFNLPGFSRCGFLSTQEQGAVWEIFWAHDKPCFYGILLNIVAVGEKALPVVHTYLGKSALPNAAKVSELFLKTIRKFTFDHPNRFFNAHLPTDRHEQMHMIGHHHTIMNSESSLSNISAHHIDEQSGITFSLQQIAT